jgi:hypothetical protein
VFVTGVHVTLSGEVSNWTVAVANPVVENVTRNDAQGRVALEFNWPAWVPVPVKWKVAVQSYVVAVDWAWTGGSWFQWLACQIASNAKSR